MTPMEAGRWWPLMKTNQGDWLRRSSNESWRQPGSTSPFCCSYWQMPSPQQPSILITTRSTLMRRLMDIIMLRWARRIVFDTLRLRQNGSHFADNIFRCIFMNEKFYILIEISLILVPEGPIDNCLDNGLAPNRRQAIIWTNADLIRWHIYAALGGDESNSLALGRCDCNLNFITFKLMSRTNILSISCQIALKWTAQNLTDD